MDSPAEPQGVRAAHAYEELHVPALFGPWAPIVAGAATIGPRDRVLDVACGTGVLAREARARVGEAGRVVGIDPDEGMLAVATALAPEVAYVRGQAESLPFEDGAFDAVVSQFGLMFFRDRAAALAEMRRVLAPGGRLAVAVWDALERSEAYPLEVEILDRVIGPEAGDALRAPFALGDAEALQALVAAAGFEDVAVVTHHGQARFPSVRRMVEADLRGWLPLLGVHPSEAQVERVLAEAERALADHVTPDGTVRFAVPAHVVSARKSAEDASGPQT